MTFKPMEFWRTTLAIGTFVEHRKADSGSGRDHPGGDDLRLVGELENWSPVFFNKHAGGGGALIGISWLPIIFGPYFAWKLATAGDRPANTGKALGAILVGLAVFVAGGFAFFVSLRNPRSPNVVMMLLGVVLWIGSGFIARTAWRGLGSTLFAYAFAARIPVLIVMYRR